MTGQVRAVCFPQNDGEFVGHVTELIAEVDKSEPIGAAVQALLRESYPQAVVRPRVALGSLDLDRVWYFYRDGSIVGNARNP